MDVKCPVCLTNFTDPRFLSCGHTFCQPCIEGVSGTRRLGPCPVCRKNTVPKTQNVSKLAKNYTLSTVIEKLSENDRKRVLCPSCKESILRSRLMHCITDNVTCCTGCLYEKHDGHKKQTLDQWESTRLKVEFQCLTPAIEQAARIAGEVKKLAEFAEQMEASLSALPLLLKAPMSTYIDTAVKSRKVPEAKALVKELASKVSSIACHLSTIAKHATKQLQLAGAELFQLLKKTPGSRHHNNNSPTGRIDLIAAIGGCGQFGGIIESVSLDVAVESPLLPLLPKDEVDELKNKDFLSSTSNTPQVLCAAKIIINVTEFKATRSHEEQCQKHDTLWTSQIYGIVTARK